MRNLLITLLFIILSIPIVAQETEELTPTVPDLTGLTVPQAARVLYEHDMLLNPIIQSLSSEEHNGKLNTVVEQSPVANTEVDADTPTIVEVSVLREFNLLLLYDPAPDTWNEDDFTLVNIGDEDINLTGVTFTNDETGQFFEARDFGRFAGRVLAAKQCFQLWGRQIRTGEVNTDIEECPTVRSSIGNISPFWQDSETFTVMQDGIYRGTCEVELERCEVWVSPQMIAEDVTEYAYFVYDEHELVVFNRSETQWMPLHQIELEQVGSLDNLAIWSSSQFNNLDFLAPQQCVIFTDGSRNTSLVECSNIAQKNSTNNTIFWSDGFTVTSSHKDGIERTCPPPSGKTFCLIPRYELNR